MRKILLLLILTFNFVNTSERLKNEYIINEFIDLIPAYKVNNLSVLTEENKNKKNCPHSSGKCSQGKDR